MHNKGGDDFQLRAEINKEATQLHNKKDGDDFLIKKGNPKTREPTYRLGSLSMHPINKHVISLQMISLQMEKVHNQKDCFY